MSEHIITETVKCAESTRSKIGQLSSNCYMSYMYCTPTWCLDIFYFIINQNGCSTSYTHMQTKIVIKQKCGFKFQKQVSQRRESNWIPQYSVGSSYLTILEILTSSAKIHIDWNSYWSFTYRRATKMLTPQYLPHDIETFSKLLVLCEGKTSASQWLPSQTPVMLQS